MCVTGCMTGVATEVGGTHPTHYIKLGLENSVTLSIAALWYSSSFSASVGRLRHIRCVPSCFCFIRGNFV